MANPIRWDNVNAPDFTGAASIMDQAQQSFGRGLGALNNIVQGGEQRRDKRIDDNSNLFMEQLRTKTPEELRNAQSNGDLDKLRAQFGKLDPNKTGSTAIDSLVTASQNRINSDDAYKDSQLFKASKDEQDAFSTLISEGNFAGARELANTDVLYDKHKSLKELDAAIRLDEQDKRSAFDRSENIRISRKAEGQRDVEYGRKEEEYQRTRGIREAGRDMFMAFQEEDAMFRDKAQAINDNAEKMFGGLEKYKDPKALDGVSDNMRLQIADSQLQMKELMDTQRSTATDRKNQFNNELINKYDASVGEASDISTNFDQILAANKEASAIDKAAVAKQLSTLNKQYTNNPIVQEKISGKTADTIAMEVYDEMSPELIDALGASDMRKVTDVLSQVASGGFEYRGAVVPVSKSMLKYALAHTDNGDFLWTDNKLQDTLTELIDNDLWKDVISGAMQYNQQADALNNSIKSSEFSPTKAASLFNSVDVLGSQERVDAQRKKAREETTKLLTNEARMLENKQKVENLKGRNASIRY